MAPLHCSPTSSFDFDDLYLPDIDHVMKSQEDEQQQKKSVRFGYCVDVCVVPHVSEMTKDEFRSSYYTSKDYKRMGRENYETLMQMALENRVDVENDSLYFRGLEVHLPNAMEERQRRRKFVVSEVLREQAMYGTIREGWVENFSSRFSAQTATAALRRGHFDMRATGQ